MPKRILPKTNQIWKSTPSQAWRMRSVKARDGEPVEDQEGDRDSSRAWRGQGIPQRGKGWDQAGFPSLLFFDILLPLFDQPSVFFFCSFYLCIRLVFLCVVLVFFFLDQAAFFICCVLLFLSTRLVLKKRKGFIKLAIRHGVPLVPTFSFGEQRVYDLVRVLKQFNINKARVTLVTSCEGLWFGESFKN